MITNSLRFVGGILITATVGYRFGVLVWIFSLGILMWIESFDYRRNL